MNESITHTTNHFSPTASLAATGVKLRQRGPLWPDPHHCADEEAQRGDLGTSLAEQSKDQRCGILRMVRDVFHVSGLLRFDACGPVVAIVLNQEACLALSFIRPLQALLAPLYVVVTLGQT